MGRSQITKFKNVFSNFIRSEDVEEIPPKSGTSSITKFFPNYYFISNYRHLESP